MMTSIAVSVSEFKAHCLDFINKVEEGGSSLNLTRHGKVVARLIPSSAPALHDTPPWLRLRGCGALLAEAEESVLDATAFDAVNEGTGE